MWCAESCYCYTFKLYYNIQNKVSYLKVVRDFCTVLHRIMNTFIYFLIYLYDV